MFRSIVLGIASAVVVLTGAFALLQCQSNLPTRRASVSEGDSPMVFVAGQASASVTGRVTRRSAAGNPTGARTPAAVYPCPGAAVVLNGPGGSRTVYANASGYYTISGVSAGSYSIQAFHGGSSSYNGTIAVADGRQHTRHLTIN